MDIPDINGDHAPVSVLILLQHHVQILNPHRSSLIHTAYGHLGCRILTLDKGVEVMVDHGILSRSAIVLPYAIGLITDQPDRTWIDCRDLRYGRLGWGIGAA